MADLDALKRNGENFNLHNNITSAENNSGGRSIQKLYLSSNTTV